MSILRKLITAVKGGATEVGEAIVDSQAIRILDQEIRNSEASLVKAKQELTNIMAQKMGVKRKVDDLNTKIDEHMNYARQALAKNDEGLAGEIAQKIAEFQNDLDPQTALLDSYVASVKQLKETIRKTENSLNTMKREVAIVKSTESVQKAQAALASRTSGSNSSMLNASESIKRIKERQTHNADRMNAALEMEKEASGDDLAAKMEAAGIIGGKSSGADILSQLKTESK